jgi:signal transduction histidine kinase
LFRIVQESLINIARHAQASRVDIELSLNDKKIELRIADNGQGFEPKKVGSQSFGLLGMVERLEVFGGKLVIDSARGRGTNLRITLPLGEPTCSAS